MTGRRAILLVAAMLIALVAIGRVALAETFTANDRDNRLIGTNQRDSISGGDGDDLMKGLRSTDSLNGGRGNDDIFAGPMDERARDTVGDRGNDFIYVFNRPAARTSWRGDRRRRRCPRGLQASPAPLERRLHKRKAERRPGGS